MTTSFRPACFWRAFNLNRDKRVIGPGMALLPISRRCVPFLAKVLAEPVYD